MIQVARLTDTHVCPIPGHGATPIASASNDTIINYLGAARVGDVCGCGAVITAGFPSIAINGRPLAHLGSPTSHGGQVVTGSPDTFGGNVGGGAGGVVIQGTGPIVDFMKLGAIGLDGKLNEQLMLELINDPQIEQRARLAGALIQPGQQPAAMCEAPIDPEYIAVAGSQHDSRRGNKMMFIGQAVRQLGEFKREKPESKRTLIVFTPAYKAKQLDAARGSALHFGVEYREVSTAKELIAYLNSGVDRKRHPIEHLAIFSHGVPHKIAFGYELPDSLVMQLDMMNHRSIQASSFSATAKINSYACRTGMGTPQDTLAEEGIQLDPQPEKSLAKALAVHLQRPVGAFIKRSDYEDTWGSSTDRLQGKACDDSGNSLPSESWCTHWRSQRDERDELAADLEAAYQNSGAINPVKPGWSPIGILGGFVEFKP